MRHLVNRHEEIGYHVMAHNLRVQLEPVFPWVEITAHGHLVRVRFARLRTWWDWFGLAHVADKKATRAIRTAIERQGLELWVRTEGVTIEEPAVYPELA